MIIQPRPQEALLKSLLRQSPQVPDVGGLRHWQVFTKAAGQSDGHLKHPTESTRVEGSKWESLWYLSLKCYGCYGLSVYPLLLTWENWASVQAHPWEKLEPNCPALHTGSRTHWVLYKEYGDTHPLRRSRGQGWQNSTQNYHIVKMSESSEIYDNYPLVN